MTLIIPFRGLRPAPGRAADVLAPPYDVLSSAEARQMAVGKPDSFLHISKPEIDLPGDIDVYAPEVYDKARENLARMIDEGVLMRDDAPRYYIYRLTWQGHSQTGIIAAASVADYDTNRIKKHEFTRPVKETDRVKQIEAVNAQTGPVMLAYGEARHIDELIARGATGEADMDVTPADGIRHQMWVVSDPELIAALTGAFDALPALYIADGHHRSAAASRICASRCQPSGGAECADEPACYFLSVIFPYHEMRILDYNRVIKDLNGHAPAEIVQRATEAFEISAPQTAPVKPEGSGIFAMYLDGHWYKLTIKPEYIPEEDPVGQLDVSLLHGHLIAPQFNITDPRRDDRIDFVGGMRGLGELQRRVDSGEMAVAFALYPTRMAELLAVADAGEVMPPKSTWFEPKLADGVVSHMLKE